MHKSRRNYYSRRSAQTPRPKEAPRGQEEQVQHPGKPGEAVRSKGSAATPTGEGSKGAGG